MTQIDVRAFFEALGNGDRAVAQWTNAGRTKNGKDYAGRGVTVFRFNDEGLVVEIQDYLDTERLSETWPA